MKSIIAYALIIVIAAAGGVVHGQQVFALAPKSTAPTEDKKAEAPAHEAKGGHDASGGHEASSGHGGKAASASLNLRELKPIVTNLADPPAAWARMEAAIVFDKPLTPEDEPLVAEISNDIIAYLRTISASYMEGSAGLHRLREDLVERAQIRSEGKVRDILLETLVVQ